MFRIALEYNGGREVVLTKYNGASWGSPANFQKREEQSGKPQALEHS